MSRVLIPVHWLTDYGGLHENVLDTAAGLVAGGWQVTVMAPPSKVGGRFVAAGVELIEDAMDDVAAAASLALSRGPFALVHAHPFQARRVGAAVAEALGIPLVVTLHGQYDDEFELYRSTVSRIVCVSSEVAAYVAQRDPCLADRLTVIPNGVDFAVFTPSEWPRNGGRKIIAIASRLDPDKGVLSLAIGDLVDHLARSESSGGFELRVAGERLYGPVANPLTEAIDRAEAIGTVAVTRVGWIDDRGALRRFFADADVVVAPGRAAMEAIACAVPTIAAASRGYVGLVTEGTLELARATNFGGVQQPATAYSPGAIVSHFRQALAMPAVQTAELRRQLRFFHDLLSVQEEHVALYSSICTSGGIT